LKFASSAAATSSMMTVSFAFASAMIAGLFALISASAAVKTT